MASEKQAELDRLDHDTSPTATAEWNRLCAEIRVLRAQAEDPLALYRGARRGEELVFPAELAWHGRNTTANKSRLSAWLALAGDVASQSEV